MIHDFVRARVADIPALRLLSETIWREHYPGIISLQQVEYMLGRMYSSETLRKEITEGHVYEIVRCGGREAGYLSFFSEEDGRVKLSKLYLLREFRTLGLGRSMLNHVVEQTRVLGAREIYLCVNKRNDLAIAAYERFGFTRAEAVVTDIGGGFVMDDWVMRFSRL